jgi:outer membrane protein assembly factor BamB
VVKGITIGNDGLTDDIYMLANGLEVVNSDGSLRWRLANDYGSPPAIAADGALFIGSNDGFVYAIDPYREGVWIDASSNLSGDYLRWRYQTGGRVQGDPVLGMDGTVFVTAEDGMLYAISASGQRKWKYAASGRPALSPDGATVYTSDSSYIRALRADTGVARWNCKVAAVNGFAVGGDGSLYATAGQCKLVKVSSAGKVLWTKTEGKPNQALLRSAPSLDAQSGRIYVGGKLGLYAFDLSGNKQWLFTTNEGWHDAAPTIGADGTIYVKSFYGDIDAVNPNGTGQWVADAGTGNVSPAIGSDGTVYVGGSALHAFHDDGEARSNLYWFLPRSVAADGSPGDLGPEVQAGITLRLQVIGVTDGEGIKNAVAEVSFYADLDKDGTLSEGDELLGSDADGVPWQIDLDTTGYSAGPHSFLAVATDFVGGTSNVLSATLQFVDTP